MEGLAVNVDRHCELNFASHAARAGKKASSTSVHPARRFRT